MGLAALAEAERSAKAGDFEKAQARRDAMATRSENSMKAQVDAVAAAYGITHKEAHDMLLAQMQMASQERIAAAGNATTIQATQMRLDAEQRGEQLRYLAGQAKLNADDFDQLMKFVQTPQGMLMTPPEAVAAYARMKATYGAVRSSPTVVDAPGTRAP